MIKILPIQAGVGNCFLVIQNNKFFLVDTGNTGYEEKIIAAITSRGLNPQDLEFIFLTHTHYDHAGSAFALKEKTGAKIIVHESEAQYLIDGFHPIPNGTSPFFKFIIAMGRINEKSRSAFKAVVPDITFNNILDLKQFDFEGTIIHTPGHTLGSSSLIIDHVAFVGDTMFNIMGKIYPPFANDQDQLIHSWGKLIEFDKKFYYPAHGKRITIDKLRLKLLKKHKI
jgi:glyoxylase-like metal-dependent hydrolase (beta-lactamase superfamily II)